MYYKALSKPVAWQTFSATAGGEDDGVEGAPGDKSFISAVAWRPHSNILLAANSLGTVKLLQLQGSSGEGEGM